jgi:hypothetical protein
MPELAIVAPLLLLLLLALAVDGGLHGEVVLAGQLG